MAITQAVSLYNYVQRLMAPNAKSDVIQLQLGRWLANKVRYLVVMPATTSSMARTTAMSWREDAAPTNWSVAQGWISSGPT